MRFEKGDVIEANGRKYRIENMDITSENTVLQYYLEPVGHDVPARMEPHTDGVTLIEYHSVSPEVIDE